MARTVTAECGKWIMSLNHFTSETLGLSLDALESLGFVDTLISNTESPELRNLTFSSERKDAKIIGDRILELIKMYGEESESDDLSIMLNSTRAFLGYMNSHGSEFVTPSIFLNNYGLVRARWKQGPERITLQFRDDGDVDYSIVMQHPIEKTRRERESGRCAQVSFLNSLSERQKPILLVS